MGSGFESFLSLVTAVGVAAINVLAVIAILWFRRIDKEGAKSRARLEVHDERIGAHDKRIKSLEADMDDKASREDVIGNNAMLRKEMRVQGKQLAEIRGMLNGRTRSE